MDMEQLYSCVPHESVTMFLVTLFSLLMLLVILKYVWYKVENVQNICYLQHYATLAIGAFGIFLLQMADKVKRFTVYPKLLPDDSWILYYRL